MNDTSTVASSTSPIKVSEITSAANKTEKLYHIVSNSLDYYANRYFLTVGEKFTLTLKITDDSGNIKSAINYDLSGGRTAFSGPISISKQQTTETIASASSPYTVTISGTVTGNPGDIWTRKLVVLDKGGNQTSFYYQVIIASYSDIFSASAKSTSTTFDVSDSSSTKTTLLDPSNPSKAVNLELDNKYKNSVYKGVSEANSTADVNIQTYDMNG